MTAADGIRKHGFSHWYERQLIESHLYLVTALLSLVMVLACVEGFSFRAPGVQPFLTLVLMLGGVLLCGASAHRYVAMLARAQQLAEQSTCGGCGSYGRLRVTGQPVPAEEPESTSLPVQCARCGHRWTMNSAGPG